MKFKLLNTFMGFSILLSLSAAAIVALEDETERYSEGCDIPSDVAYCMDVMRVGTKFNDETAEHFVRLETLLSDHALEECSWESFDGKKTPGECISTLSRFADENEVEDDVLMERSIDLDVSEKGLNKVCYKACKAVKCLKCKFKFSKKKRKKCKKKCKKKCRKKCDKVF